MLRLNFGVKLNPQKCPLPNLRDPHLVRQLHLLRLDRQKLAELAVNYEEKLSPLLRYSLMFYGQAIIELSNNQENELLEFLEWYEKALDLALEMVENYGSIQLNHPLADIELEALLLSFEIEKRENNNFFEQLFNGLEPSNLLSNDISMIYNNAREIDEN